MVKRLQGKTLLFIQLRLLVVGEIRDLGNRTKVGNRVSVTIKAPAHGQLLGSTDDRHLVDTPVTGNTSNSTVDMCAVIEICVIRDAIDPDPLNRETRVV